MSESPAETAIAEAITSRPIHGEANPSPTKETIDIGRGRPIALDVEGESDE